jgi:hypothetical protein
MVLLPFLDGGNEAFIQWKLGSAKSEMDNGNATLPPAIGRDSVKNFVNSQKLAEKA